MKLYGLIGYPLGHSFSKAYFEERFRRENIGDSRFENFPLESIGELPAMLAREKQLRGFNVTIPYKQQVMAYLDAIDPTAAEIGAVNCVRVAREGAKASLTGYNTDAEGFRESLFDLIGGRRPKALVLGTGGASKAVAYVLGQAGIEFKMVSRSGSGDIFSYLQLGAETVSEYRLIVNTTPLGTFPDIGGCPDIPYDSLTAGHFLLDLVYNPSQTEFLRRGRLRGATVKNGYQMLISQAEAGYRIFTE